MYYILHFALIILSVIGSYIGVASFLWPKIRQSNFFKKHQILKTSLLIMIILLLIAWMPMQIFWERELKLFSLVSVMCGSSGLGLE